MTRLSKSSIRLKGDAMVTMKDMPKYHEATAEVDVSEFRKIIQNRRSVRSFDGTPVPEKVMHECLDWALLAPNSSNLQPWEFVWVRSADKKKQLADVCLGQSAATTATEMVVCIARIDLWHQISKDILAHYEKLPVAVPKSATDYYKKIVPYVYGQDFLGILGLAKTIVSSIVGLNRPVPREPFSRSALITWATKTCALACENFMLGMTAHGFDTCAMEGFDSKRLKKLLGLNRGAIPVMVISCGKRTDGGVYGPRLRMPRERFVREI